MDLILATILEKHGDQDEIAFLVGRVAAGDIAARKQLADAVCMRPAKLPPSTILEISRWGINDQ